MFQETLVRVLSRDKLTTEDLQQIEQKEKEDEERRERERIEKERKAKEEKEWRRRSGATGEEIQQ